MGRIFQGKTFRKQLLLIHVDTVPIWNTLKLLNERALLKCGLKNPSFKFSLELRGLSDLIRELILSSIHSSTLRYSLKF